MAKKSRKHIGTQLSQQTQQENKVKKYGEVFTPPRLVNKMLDQLPVESINDPIKTFLDPTCGDGNFLVEIVRRKLHAGSTPEQALSTTFGIEIQLVHVQRCRQRLVEVCMKHQNVDEPDQMWVFLVAQNIVRANALTFDYKFLAPSGVIRHPIFGIACELDYDDE